MNIKEQFGKAPSYLVWFVLLTVPIIFGAVHPIVYASYSAIVLLGLGSFLCFAYPFPEQETSLIPRLWLLPLLLILFFCVFQSVPLPLSWIEVLSPARAERVAMVNTLAKTSQTFVTLSEHGQLSLPPTILLFSLIIYYCTLRVLLLREDKFFRILYLIIIIVGVFEALYGLFQFLSPRIGILWLPLTAGRASHGTIIYKNQYASLLNMCWPLALAGASVHLQNFLKPGSTNRRKKTIKERIRRMDEKAKYAPLFFLATGIILLAVLFSLSRGGMIAMLLVMILLNFYLPISRKAKLVFIGLFVFFISAYGALLGLDTVMHRFDTIGQAGTKRFDLYLSSIPMLMDHALSGIGFGSYSLLSPVYLKGFPPNIHWDKVHNEYIQLTIELGIPIATVLFVWLAAAMSIAGVKLFKIVGNRSEKLGASVIIAGGAFCGLIGFFVHGVADFGWRLPANLFYAVTLAALVSYGLEKGRKYAS